MRELRKLAREKGIEFEVVASRGKGSHYRVRFGNRETTVKSGEPRPSYVKLIKAQLGIE